MRRTRWLLAVAAAVLMLAGCGDGGDVETAEPSDRPQQAERREPPKNLKSVGLTLDGYSNAENVGVWMAQELGYFEEAGMDVEIYIPISPVLPVTNVALRRVDLSITQQPQLAMAKEEGVPVVAVRTLVPQPTGAMIWLGKSKIGGLSDLKGRTIAIAGLPYEEKLLVKVLAQAGLSPSDVKVKHVGHLLVPALVSGRADAIFGGSWNIEGIELDTRGLEPVITRVEDLDLPSYDELVLITRRDRLAKDPELIRAFVKAVDRGTAAAIEDPEAARDVLLVQGNENSSKAVEAQLDATLPLLSKAGR